MLFTVVVKNKLCILFNEDWVEINFNVLVKIELIFDEAVVLETSEGYPIFSKLVGHIRLIVVRVNV